MPPRYFAIMPGSLEELPILPHGGYENLRSYKVAEEVYHATIVFCDRFYRSNRRMTDQMVQAARSGVRNISEGSGAAATSKKSEMLLTNVARASLRDELIPDFRTFLKTNGLVLWDKDSANALAMRKRLKHDSIPNLPPTDDGAPQLTGLDGLVEFVKTASPEIATNALLCATHQAVYLLKRQLESQARDFTENGGFSEKLYQKRQEARRKQG